MGSGKRPIKVLSITSGKGGVGKTQVTANLALSLQRQGKKVLIFDGDMGLANIDIIYNIQPQYNLSHLINGSRSIQEVLCDGPEGVKVLPAASGVAELTSLGQQQKMNLMDQIDQLEGMFDFFLIDTAAGISDNVMYLNTAAQHILVVVTPEPTSITDAYALIKVLSSRHNEKSFQIITNQTRSEAEAENIFNSLVTASDQFLDAVQLWHLHNLPYSEKVRQSITKRQPMITYDEQGDLTQAYAELATKVERLDQQNIKGGMQFFLKQALGG